MANINFDYKNLSPFKWFVIENFPFIEADFDALTEWQLFCKLGKEINKIIDSQNIVGEQAEILTNAFNQLKDYVDNYFANLDVQEEINNKLNDMVEDGTLQEIITSYLQINGILAFNTVAEMKQASNLLNGSFAKTYGFNQLNDNGGAFYKIRSITNEDIVDELNIIALNNTLVAELIYSNSLHIYNTVAEMKEARNLVAGNNIKTLGFNQLNDNGGAFYKIRSITNEDIVDELNIIALNNTLVAELIYSNSLHIYNTVAEMKEARNLVAGNNIKTLGFNQLNDNGGAFYKIRTKIETDVIDNAFIISLYNENLVAELIINESLILSQLGATIDTDATNILNLALAYIDAHNEIKLILDKAYTFNEINLTDINNVTIEGINPKKRIKVNESIIIPTNHNTFKNLAFELQTDTTLVVLTGRYNNFNFCNFYGKNNNTGIGINISSYVNTFTDCAVREFKTNVIVNKLGNQTNFINCILVNCDNALEGNSNVIINSGLNVNFTNCDLEKGYHIIETNGGIVNFNGCYIEGATSQYHIRCFAGTVSILNNNLHNIRIEKYTACKLTINNNLIEKSIATDYTLFPREANIGYLVALDNKFKDDIGLFVVIDSMKVSGVNLPCPRYYDFNNQWQVGTRNDYLHIIQEACYGYSGVGKHTCQTLPLDAPQIGTSYNRLNRPEMANAYSGHCFYDTTLQKLVVKKSSTEWVDVNGVNVDA